MPSSEDLPDPVLGFFAGRSSMFSPELSSSSRVGLDERAGSAMPIFFLAGRFGWATGVGLGTESTFF